MKLVHLKDLAKEFYLNPTEMRDVILAHGNKIGIKLLHEIDKEVVISEIFQNMVRDTVSALTDSLTDYNYIRSKATDSVALNFKGNVYYLFNDNELVYVGQSVSLQNRIGSHIMDGKKFNRVYSEVVDFKHLLLKERFYIHRDIPKLNVCVMSNREYFAEILLLIHIDEYTFNK